VYIFPKKRVSRTYLLAERDVMQGDFIFYSVLVAKSAQYSFTCFISSFLVILAGLGGTLVLLAVYKHALPALPISIFLAVFFYVMVRFVAEPWIHAVLSTPFYV